MHIDFAGHHKRRIVIALYNYTAREDTDVSFVKGDRMEVLDDTESDWWRVIHLTTRQEGLIPWNFVAEERSVNSEEYVQHVTFSYCICIFVLILFNILIKIIRFLLYRIVWLM